jgi:hypothetical protein
MSFAFLVLLCSSDYNKEYRKRASDGTLNDSESSTLR